VSQIFTDEEILTALECIITGKTSGRIRVGILEEIIMSRFPRLKDLHLLEFYLPTSGTNQRR
jgi:hypothetical protein